MRTRMRCLVVVAVVLALPIAGSAQEATLSGTVTDSTGGVLPGVTVVAVQEASGNTFETITDTQGVFRIPARTGRYRLTAQLTGFATVTQSLEQLLVGQQAVVNFELAPSGVQQEVTVTGEALLIDTASSKVGANIDPLQVSELPVQGRNWLDLTMLAPGSRTNSVQQTPTADASTGTFQINIDGQEVTQILSGGNFGQPRLSRDAIGEFQLITNRFDATQGRSTGLQVNAVTKSGTNSIGGTLSSFARHSRFRAADFVAGRVLPYSNQQVSATLGGPIRRDRVHFFGNYEYEREPETFVYTTPYPRFNLDMKSTRKDQKGGLKLDVELSPQTRMMMRWGRFRQETPLDSTVVGGSASTPSSVFGAEQWSDQFYGTLTQVLSNRAVTALRGGYSRFGWARLSRLANAKSLAGGKQGPGWGAPVIQLEGLTAGQTLGTSPQDFDQEAFSIRNDSNYSFTVGGRHDLKAGGEYIYMRFRSYICRMCNGQLDARGRPIPANIESIFPDLFDVSTWNMAALSPITRRWSQGLGTFDMRDWRHTSGVWVQDDWAISQRLMLNLGMRYDVVLNAFANDIEIDPRFAPGGRPEDLDNIAPRLGFAYTLNERTVLRGGWGKFFGEVQNTHAVTSTNIHAIVEVANDGRPDFAANPFNGPLPTFEDVVRLGLRRAIGTAIRHPDSQIPFSYQGSLGVQRQVGDTMAFEADYVWTGGRAEPSDANINLAFNPATGANYPSSEISRLPYPDWGVVNMRMFSGRSNYHGLQTAFRKRLSRQWQLTATYTLSGYWNASGPPLSGLTPVPFPVAPDMGGEYTFAATDQRHRAVVNGIWELGRGFQLSGLYFFGSGERYSTSYGGDRRDQGGSGEARLRPNGTIVPRNSFVGDPIHRMDSRIQRQFRLGGVSLDGILEVFNVFNHVNFGSYVTQESNARFGLPTQNLNVAYQPRTLQLGLRLAF